MARTFRGKRQLHPVAELNVTNLIDLGFTLLIIFMIATPLIQQGQRIPLDLPVESAKPQKTDKDPAQVIGIDRNGNYYWGDRRVSLAQLRTNLDGIAGLTKPPVLRIEAEFSLQYQQVISVLDEVKKRGLNRISLETQTSK